MGTRGRLCGSLKFTVSRAVAGAPEMDGVMCMEHRASCLLGGRDCHSGRALRSTVVRWLRWSLSLSEHLLCAWCIKDFVLTASREGSSLITPIADGETEARTSTIVCPGLRG